MIKSWASWDILPHQYPTIEVPGTVFHLVNTPGRVPTTAGMVALIPTWEDPTIPLGPFTEEDPETEVVRPRHIQYLPGYYAAHFVHRRGVNAKVAFEELHGGAMQARDEVGICGDVLAWLKAAATARGGRGPTEWGAHCISPSGPGSFTGERVQVPDRQGHGASTGPQRTS